MTEQDLREIKQAMAICEKYNVSIMAKGENPITPEYAMTVRMYDSDTFFTLASDYYRFGGSSYCANYDGYSCHDNCDGCNRRSFYQPYVKYADGVWFYCAVPQDSDFEAEQRGLMTLPKERSGKRR